MTLEVGQQVGRYIVDARLGSGGMATVYKVRHQELGSPFALKVLDLVTDVLTERFRSEGLYQARLDHPHVVKVFDVMTVEGRPALLLEYIEGESLREWMDIPRELDQVEAVFRGILSGVDKAHEVGLAHRDLKPENVLMAKTPDGEWLPKVADFGIAKQIDGDGPTRTGIGLGTPGYMAPEQIREAKDVDHRADIFALGVILYEMCCGLRPFRGADTLDVIQSAANGLFTPPTELRAGLPPHIEEAILGCLVTNRVMRFQTCADVRAALDGQVRSATEETWVHPEEGGNLSTAADLLDQIERLDVPSLEPATQPDTVVREPAAPPPAAPSRAAPVAVAAIAAAVAAAGASFLAPQSTPEPPPAGTLQLDSVIVTPFTVEGPPGHDWRGSGLATDLTFALAASGGTRVLSQSALARYEHPPSPDQLGRDLAVDYVIEGSMRTAGGTLTTQTSVVRTSDASVAWTATHTGPDARVAGTNGLVVNGLLAAMGLPERPPLQSDERLAALTPYVKGREIVRRYDEARYPEADAALRQAIEADPTFGDARAWLARLYMHEGWHGEGTERDLIAEAEDLLTEGLASDPDNPLLMRTLGRVMLVRGRVEPAFEMLNKAVAGADASADLYIDRYEVEVRAGALELAGRDIAKAQELDPYSVRVWTNSAWYTIYSQQWGELEPVLAKAAAQGVVHHWLPEAKAESLRRHRQTEALEAYVAVHPVQMSVAMHQGDEDWLAAEVNERIDLGRERPNGIIERARYQAALGRTDDALESLATVLELYPGFLCHTVDPVFDEAKQTQRWAEIEAKAKAGSEAMSRRMEGAWVP